MIGKNKDSFAEAAIVEYANRVERFNGFEIKYLKEAKNNKNLTAAMDVEADNIFKELSPNDYVILLDEKGKEYTSVQFAAKIEQLRLKNFRQLVYIAGGAYG
ncbi:MAG TPA: 23S rRNA (pseudouridine(1915)-N(3))-methyltransferase RlmH, partial [Bacteroidia bacterium]|nr:23S rRNA (pseudouridine(1915)-N(3))-methyltransferase RlmH [Bacteroidia bacterium]